VPVADVNARCADAHEDIVLENLSSEPHDVKLELTYSSDFADVMEAQKGGNGAGRSYALPLRSAG